MTFEFNTDGETPENGEGGENTPDEDEFIPLIDRESDAPTLKVGGEKVGPVEDVSFTRDDDDPIGHLTHPNCRMEFDASMSFEPTHEPSAELVEAVIKGALENDLITVEEIRRIALDADDPDRVESPDRVQCVHSVDRSDGVDRVHCVDQDVVDAWAMFTDEVEEFSLDLEVGDVK